MPIAACAYNATFRKVCWRLVDARSADRGADGSGELACRNRLGCDATGHEWATGIAIEKLPEDVPAFVRDPAVLPELALMARSWNARRPLVRCTTRPEATTST
jgi:hypothetical protein